jgi:hypothetical protein
MDQKTFKRELKQRIILGLNYGLQAIGEVLNEESLLMKEFIGFQSQYNDLSRMASQNKLAYSEVEVGFNKIRMGLIDIIDRMEARDTTQEETLPELKNNELQFRKSNFFELLDIHYSNLANVTLVMQYSYSDEKGKDEYRGIDAIRKIYIEFFEYGFKDQASFGANVPKEIPDFAFEFFDSKFPRLDPYMKTLKFILEYIVEEELEQSFFLGITKSVVSTYESLLIFYYALSNIEPDFGKLLLDTDFFEERLQTKLIHKDHYNLLTR